MSAPSLQEIAAMIARGVAYPHLPTNRYGDKIDLADWFGGDADYWMARASEIYSVRGVV